MLTTKVSEKMTRNAHESAAGISTVAEVNVFESLGRYSLALPWQAVLLFGFYGSDQ